jgi:hypothetical protein
VLRTSRPRFVTTVLVLAALTAVVPARVAGAASPYQTVLRAYEQSGTVPPCRFSAATLAEALKGVDSYGAQYFADFTQAVNDALSARAAGACSGSPRRNRGGAPAGSGGGRPRASGPGVGIPAHLGALTASTGGSIPAPLLLLGALALGAAVATGVTLVRRVRARH